MQVESIVLPFIGTRDEDYLSFQYLPLGFSESLFRFAIPQWVVNRESLGVLDKIDIHLGIRLGEKIFSTWEIAESSWDPEIDSQVYLARLSEEAHRPPHVTLSPSNLSVKVELIEHASELELLRQAIKDCWMLKRGIVIYLKHLMPYFSRISGFPKEEYPLLRETLLEEPIRRTQENAASLEALIHELAQPSSRSNNRMPDTFDLHAFASSLSTGLEIELFRLSFESELALSYLTSVKELERRLFDNHNVVVALYAEELEQ